MDVRVEGAGELRALARRLKEAGLEGKGLRKELLKKIRASTKPAVAAARASAAANLPHSGGLAALITHSTFTKRTEFGGRDIGVTIAARHKKASGYTGMIQLKALDRGRLRHPVFGNREVWKTQAVKPGWFTDPMEASAPQVRGYVIAAMKQTAEKITRH